MGRMAWRGELESLRAHLNGAEGAHERLHSLGEQSLSPHLDPCGGGRRARAGEGVATSGCSGREQHA